MRPVDYGVWAAFTVSGPAFTWWTSESDRAFHASDDHQACAICQPRAEVKCVGMRVAELSVKGESLSGLDKGGAGRR